MNRVEQAVEKFEKGFNCSQAVLGSYCEQFGLDQETALKILDNLTDYTGKVNSIKTEREKLSFELRKLSIVKKVYPSEANYLLCKFNDADATYRYLIEKGIIVRNRSKQPHCENCLRISIGTPDDNKLLMKYLLDHDKQ